MTELGIDIETYSSRDLAACGVYRYCEAPDFAVLLFAYSIDGAPAVCVDVARGEELPAEIRAALTDPAVTKTAFNAAFERVCLGRWLGSGPLPPSQWRCTMIAAARMGFPLALGQCADVLGLKEGKMAEGRALIRLFSSPGRGGVRRFPSDDPEKWETFKRYNIRDVDVEQAILRKVRRLAPAPFDEELYIADQEINDRGVMIDRRLAENAARLDGEIKARLLEEAREISGLDNPNSPTQIKEYLRRTTGQAFATLNKKSLDDMEKSLRFYPKARRLIALRREMGKTSNRKYAAMLECVCDDGRVHGLLQFYGAARTGRWAGRLVQVQNLPQNHIPDIDTARSLVKAGDLDELEMNYAKPAQVLSELIRTAFVAAPGCTLHVCDFSAIEARVVAWLAGEDWVLDVFRDGGDIYCSTASRMFGVPVEKHGVNAELRQQGKIAVLALGYGGGAAALAAFDHSGAFDEAGAWRIVELWRESNPCIVRFWNVIERAAKTAIGTGRSVAVGRGVTVSFRWGALLITLPSGRVMCYPRARIGTEEKAGWSKPREVVEYEGMEQTKRKWGTLRTYGGKLTENIVQAIARDILGIVLLRARSAGLHTVFHIHDEIVVEAPPERTLAEVTELFSKPIPWAPGLPLKGAGYTTPYYLKD